MDNPACGIIWLHMGGYIQYEQRLTNKHYPFWGWCIKKQRLCAGKEKNMKIHVFSNYTGMVAKSFSPDYKTRVEIVGGIKTGTLSVGSKNYEIKGGEALVPLSDLTGKEYSVSITAKDGGKVKHWNCGKIARTPSGMYTPGDIDARGALIEAYTAIDELRNEVKTATAVVKKLQDKSARKFLGGVE